ncbi:hypothetical protein ACJX0J_008366, partial [Zea mays]
MSKLNFNEVETFPYRPTCTKLDEVEAFPYLSTCTKATRSPKNKIILVCFLHLNMFYRLATKIHIGRMSAKEREKIEGNKNGFIKNIMKKEKLITNGRLSKGLGRGNLAKEREKIEGNKNGFIKNIMKKEKLITNGRLSK